MVRLDDATLGFHAVLADFGMSASLGDWIKLSKCQPTKDQRTNNAWLAPELLFKNCSSEDEACVSLEGDIWAFGCVMLEVSRAFGCILLLL